MDFNLSYASSEGSLIGFGCWINCLIPPYFDVQVAAAQTMSSSHNGIRRDERSRAGGSLPGVPVLDEEADHERILGVDL